MSKSEIIKACEEINIKPLGIVCCGNIDVLFKKNEQQPSKYVTALKKILPYYDIFYFTLTRPDCFWLSFKKCKEHS